MNRTNVVALASFIAVSAEGVARADVEPDKPEQARNFIERKSGDAFTLTFGRSEVSLYGNLDVSFDYTTKGLQDTYVIDGKQVTPEGKLGWMPAISTNLSYVGVRGMHDFDLPYLNFVYQVEAQIDISATAGTVNTNSNNDNIVKGALSSRNSFIGLGGLWGALKIGKTDAPYKNSTARLNPFVAMLGDYAVIMGNTGGDNRVEFGTRIDHALWYESPKLYGFSMNALYAPGQNRSSDNSITAAGESGCAGGNAPGSGALPPGCNDGSFGNAFSADIEFKNDFIYVTAAYELHRGVNRTSDTATLDPRDVGDERALKAGVLFTLPTIHTRLGAIVEDMRRTLPSDLEAQNERNRRGYWFTITQPFGERDSVSLGWAHAGSTPGDPGQHNTPPAANPDNSADMFTAVVRHYFDKFTSIYLNYALTNNHPAAHYDLGAGGRAVTTDCHDGSQLAAFDVTANKGAGGVTGTGPTCYAGGRLQGVSVGLNYKF